MIWNTMRPWIEVGKRWSSDEDGQGLVEYGLILVLVSIIAFAALDSIGVSAIDLINLVNATLLSVSS